jgi:short-subunit dehydrogenase
MTKHGETDMRTFEIRGGVAVVTGAASGIGQQLAVRLADMGCHLALADVNEQALEALGDRLRRPGLNVSVHRLDVGAREATLAFPDEVMAAHGRVTLLINNAGIALGGYYEQLRLEDIERLMDINLLGPMRLTRVFLPILRRSPSAYIANVSSLFGIIAPPGQAAYAAAKYGIRGFSESLRHELRGTSVGLTVVHPGGIKTNISKNMLMAQSMTEEQIAKERRLHSKLLTLDPDEAARQILDAVANRRRRLLIGRDAKQAVAMQRLFPVSYWTVAEMMDGRMRKRHAENLAQLGIPVEA